MGLKSLNQLKAKTFELKKERTKESADVWFEKVLLWWWQCCAGGERKTAENCWPNWNQKLWLEPICKEIQGGD